MGVQAVGEFPLTQSDQRLGRAESTDQVTQRTPSVILDPCYQGTQEETLQGTLKVFFYKLWVQRIQMRARKKQKRSKVQQESWRNPRPLLLELAGTTVDGAVAFAAGICAFSLYNKCSQRARSFCLLTEILLWSCALAKGGSHHAKPTEEDHFLYSRGIKLCVCPWSCDSPGDPSVDQSHHPLQDRGSAGQCLWEGAGQVHGRDAVWAFPRRRSEAMRIRSQALSIFM